MQKYWAWLGLNLGKHAGIVSIVGLLLTIVLGFGITKLEFATGQDSYLNKSEDVYKNSLAYQDLFGGQAMVTLVTLGEGEELTDLFTPEAVAQWEAIEAEIKEKGGDDIFGVVTPLTALAVHQRPRAAAVRERRGGRGGPDPARRRRARSHTGGQGHPHRVVGRDARPGRTRSRLRIG